MLVLFLVIVQLITLCLIVKVFDTMDKIKQMVDFFVLSKLLKGVKK